MKTHKNVFIVRGSEDGNIGVYTTRKQALKKVIDYVYQDYNNLEDQHLNDKTFDEIYPKYKAQEGGFFSLEHSYETVSAEIQEFTLNY